MRGSNAFAPDAVEGFRCDATPTVTNVTVCGQSLPATVHLEWTQCAVPEGRGDCAPGPDGHARPPEADGGAAPLADGGTPPPDSDGDGALHPPPGACGSDGGTCQAGGPPMAGPSTGTVDITNTYTPSSDCSSIQEQQTATYDLSRTEPNGDVVTIKGTSSSTATLAAGGPPTDKSTTIDVTRTVTDASGTVLRSVHLTGTRSETFSSDTPPTRTVNESLNSSLSDGTSSTVTLNNVVYPPMSTCRFPTSGTLVETSSDGTTHTLTYGPTCGAGTLDGTAVQLNTHIPREGDAPPAGDGGFGPHRER